MIRVPGAGDVVCRTRPSKSPGGRPERWWWRMCGASSPVHEHRDTERPRRSRRDHVRTWPPTACRPAGRPRCRKGGRCSSAARAAACRCVRGEARESQPVATLTTLAATVSGAPTYSAPDGPVACSNCARLMGAHPRSRPEPASPRSTATSRLGPVRRWRRWSRVRGRRPQGRTNLRTEARSPSPTHPAGPGMMAR